MKLGICRGACRRCAFGLCVGGHGYPHGRRGPRRRRHRSRSEQPSEICDAGRRRGGRRPMQRWVSEDAVSGQSRLCPVEAGASSCAAAIGSANLQHVQGSAINRICRSQHPYRDGRRRFRGLTRRHTGITLGSSIGVGCPLGGPDGSYAPHRGLLFRLLAGNRARCQKPKPKTYGTASGIALRALLSGAAAEAIRAEPHSIQVLGATRVLPRWKPSQCKTMRIAFRLPAIHHESPRA